jgi:hypothetical protein
VVSVSPVVDPVVVLSVGSVVELELVDGSVVLDEDVGVSLQSHGPTSTPPRHSAWPIEPSEQVHSTGTPTMQTGGNVSLPLLELESLSLLPPSSPQAMASRARDAKGASRFMLRMLRYGAAPGQALE